MNTSWMKLTHTFNYLFKETIYTLIEVSETEKKSVFSEG